MMPFSDEGAVLDLLSLVGTGRASYDRLVQRIQRLGREQIEQIIHQARQESNSAHPSTEAANIAVSLLTACALTRRESEAASGVLIWFMRWSDRFSGPGRPESTLPLARRTVAGWVWLVARCVEETTTVTEAELWFLPRMYRLVQVPETSCVRGETLLE